MDDKFLVGVRCYTFNHVSYIKDALDGFCMQETSFPFVCVIVDDASTDGEQETIKAYLQEHFDLDNTSIVRNEETDDYVMTVAQHKENKNCFFVVYFLKYNHYGTQKLRQRKSQYISEWFNHVKYVALCEGDDYWITFDKLQKQVFYLEKHTSCSMVCNRTKLFSERLQQFIGENYCYKKSQIVDAKDVICKTGEFISTCSIVYKVTVMENYPDYCLKCKVGDYPLQIMCAMKGNVYYFNEIMSVYRVQNTNSWTGKTHWGKMNIQMREITKSIVEMFRGFAKDYPKYKTVFNDKIAVQINTRIPLWRSPQKEIIEYLDFFSDEIKDYSLRWRLDMWIRKVKIPKIRWWYTKQIMRNYSPNKKYYIK